MFIMDNLSVLDNLNSACVDLIYLDPPFNSNRHYAAPVGSAAAGAEFKDAWTLDDVDEAWIDVIQDENKSLATFLESVKGFGGKGDMSYLIYMSRRLLEMHRVLKESGSIYLHCDATMSHSLKIVMDCIFGKKNFRNEIIWCYRGAGYPKKDFGKRHDVLLRYSKTKDYTFNLDAVREEYAETTKQRFKHYIGNKRKGTDFGEQSLNPLGKHPDDWWQIQPIAPSAKERKGYPTQKPLKLLEKIIKASSNPGDIVLDPFCGCATALVAAEALERQWIGIDISPKAEMLVKSRLEDAQDMYSTKKARKGGSAWKKVNMLKVFAPRTDKTETIIKPKKYKATLYGLQAGNCKLCGEHFQTQHLEIDHINPVSKGGGDTTDNLQLLCGHCNRTKGNKSWAEALAEHKKRQNL